MQTHTDHVQKHLLGFMSKGVVVTKKWLFLKLPACRPTVLQRWRLGRLAAAKAGHSQGLCY